MRCVVSDFKDVTGLWVKSYGKGGIDQVVTKSYARWNNVKKRCKVGGEHQTKNQTYLGCTMSDTFKDFQTFTDWHVQQTGYNFDGYQIDKDILHNGNKEYNESVCVPVPPALNTFLISCTARRGKWPQGVNFHKRDERFQASVRIDAKLVHLGYHSTPEAAYNTYKSAKEAEAYRWYERLKAGEFVVDERVIERMRTWTLEPDDLNSNYEENTCN